MKTYRRNSSGRNQKPHASKTEALGTRQFETAQRLAHPALVITAEFARNISKSIIPNCANHPRSFRNIVDSPSKQPLHESSFRSDVIHGRLKCCSYSSCLRDKVWRLNKSWILIHGEQTTVSSLWSIINTTFVRRPRITYRFRVESWK
jgi:hypothetical protein